MAARTAAEIREDPTTHHIIYLMKNYKTHGKQGHPCSQWDSIKWSVVGSLNHDGPNHEWHGYMLFTNAYVSTK